MAELVETISEAEHLTISHKLEIVSQIKQDCMTYLSIGPYVNVN